MSPDTAITRSLLRQIYAELRAAFPEIRSLIKSAGVTSTMRGQYFVQICTPGRPLFNFDCRAFNSFEARYKAWSSFLQTYHPDHEAAL